MPTLIKAIRTGGDNEEVELKASRDGDLRIAQYLPPFAMLCAQGRVFAFDISGATAKAPVAAMPTTSPEWDLYNANPAGGAHIVLLHVGIASASGSMGLGISIVAGVGVGAQTAQTTNYTDADISCLDGTAKKPNIILANNVGVIGTQPAWTVFRTLDQSDVLSVGSGVVARPDGLVSAPPKSSIFFEPVGLNGSPTGLFDITIVVAQIQLDT
ncbi:hypothetical protein LCGC14_0382990 [marine sediment metagenome]|uniref:Uncharacterized protein n=1 Tax=marine sediment metagenome TaxID=412755 RepID=A0A0F9T1H7_9ZZZZ